MLLLVLAELLSRQDTYQLSGNQIIGFLTSPIGRFDDFYNNLPSPERLWASPTRAGFVFPPGGHLLYGGLMFVTGGNESIAFIVFSFASCSIFAYSLFLWCKRWQIAIPALLLYPAVFCFFRGNNEMLLVGIFQIALWLRYRRPNSSLIVASLGQMIELSPLSFVVLVRKRLAYFLSPILVFATLSLVLVSLNSWSNPIEYLNRLLQFNFDAANSRVWTLYNNGFAVLEQWFRSTTVFEDFHIGSSNGGTGTARLVVAVLVTLVCLFAKDVRDVQVIVGSSWVLAANNSFDYRLCWLILPLLLLISDRDKTRFRRIQQILLVLVVVPKHLITFHSEYLWPVGATENGIVNVLALLLLISLTLGQVIRSQFALWRVRNSSSAPTSQ